MNHEEKYRILNQENDVFDIVKCIEFLWGIQLRLSFQETLWDFKSVQHKTSIQTTISENFQVKTSNTSQDRESSNSL